MKTRGFIVFALIALLTFCCFSAKAEDFALPVSVTRVEEEAFCGDSALTEAALREGVTEIGPRAFADCVNLTSIELPNSLTRIAADAFDGSENVTIVCGLHSAAYAFAREQGLAVRLRGDYAVSSPRTEAGSIYALVAAAEDCELYAEALSEDMTETLFSSAVACAGGEETEVRVPCGELPAYYVLRLTLRDGAGRAISAPCVTRQYTAAYEAFEQLTPADFSGRNVLDYGDAGFAVAKEGVTEIRTASGSDGSYTFTPSGDVRPGDCLIIGGQPVKAASVIRNADGTVTVAADPDIVLADFFDTIHIDMSADMGAAMQQDENAEGRESALTAQAREGRNADESATLIEISTSHTVGPVTASIRFSAKLRYKLIYDAKHFGKDYFETESYVEIKGSARVSAKKDSGSAFSVKLFEGFVPTPIPGMSARVKAELPIKVSGEGSFGFSFTGKYGFRYNPIDGQVPMEGFTMKPDVELKAKAEIKAGIGASLGLRTMGVIGIDLKCEAGAKVSAAKTFLDTPSTKRHACSLCFDIDVKKYAEISASLNYEITEWLKGDILKIEIASYEESIWKGYLSVINDAESVHGGRIVLDEGDCPNYQYLMTVKTYDENNKAVTGIPVTATRTDRDGKGASGASVMQAYVYPGVYLVKGEFPQTTVSQRAAVNDGPETVSLYAASVKVNGKAYDTETLEAVPRVSVSTELQDGSIARTVTDDKGEYEIELPVGDYNLRASSPYYQDWTSAFTTVGVGLSNTVMIPLTPVPVEVSGVVTRQQDGKALSGATVTFTGRQDASATTDKDGFYSLTLKAGSYTATANAAHCNEQAKAVDIYAKRTNTVNFTLSGEIIQHTISGIVTCEPDGEPAVGALVQCKADDETSVLAFTDAQGAYKFVVEGDEVKLTASLDGFSPYEETLALPQTGDVTHDIRLELPKGYLMIKVLDAMTGEQLDNLTFTLVDTDGHDADVNIHNFDMLDGWVRYSVPPGDYTLSARRTGYSTTRVSVTVRVQEHTYVEMELLSNGYHKLDIVVLPGIHLEPIFYKKDYTLPDVSPYAEHLTFVDWYIQYIDGLHYTAYAVWTDDGTFEYTYDPTLDAYSVYKYDGSFTDVVVPGLFNDKPVIMIGQGAFSWSNAESIQRITLPEGLVCIGNCAFGSCRSLMQINLPDTITSIGNSAFANNWQLQSITLPPNLKVIEGELFRCCSNLTSVTIPYGCERILYEAFYECKKLQHVSLPESITVIGNNAFARCYELIIDRLPGSIEEIGKHAFSGCKFAELTIPASLTKWGEGAFGSLQEPTTVTFAEGVTKIGYSAFQNAKIEEVVFPDTLTTIQSGAFCYCPISSIDLPSSLESIGSYAFSKTKIQSVVLPYGLKILDGFAECDELTSVYIPSTTTRILSDAFYNCKKLTTITIPSSVTDIGSKAFAHSGLTSIEIPDSVSYLGPNAFYDCGSLSSVKLPQGLYAIDYDTFWHCGSLESLVVPEGVTRIGTRAFLDSGLKELWIPASVTSCGYNTFPTHPFTVYTPAGSYAATTLAEVNETYAKYATIVTY